MKLGRGVTLDFDSPVLCLSLPRCPVGTGKDFEAPHQKAQSHTRTASRDNYAIHWGGAIPQSTFRPFAYQQTSKAIIPPGLGDTWRPDGTSTHAIWPSFCPLAFWPFDA